MGKVIDLNGKKFTRWTVIGFSHQVGKAFYWNCRCECGVERAVFGADLKRGGSLSCGCLMREKAAERMTTHGQSRQPIFRVWSSIKQRCYNEKKLEYYLYGGRGITVCARWLESFENFMVDMGPSWKKGRSIDRINVDGNYEATNCRWATPKQQADNRRNNIYLETPSGTMRLADAAEKYGISPVTIKARIRYGWAPSELLIPVRRDAQHR